MRKVLAGAVAAIALSWGGSGAAAETKAEQKASDAEKAMKGEAERTRGDVAAPDARTQSGKQPAGAQQASGGEKKKHPLFEGKNNFDLKGKVSAVSPDSITIQREELPSAKLHVSKDTKVEVDGQKASIQQLKQGQDVKASFNLQGAKPEAVEIKADKLKKDDRKEMQEQKAETQKEMNERAREAQQQQKNR